MLPPKNSKGVSTRMLQHEKSFNIPAFRTHLKRTPESSGIPNATLNGAEEVLRSTRPRGNQGQERGTGHKRIANALMGSPSPSNPSGLSNSSHRLHSPNPFKPSIHFIQFNYPIQTFSLNQPQSASPSLHHPQSASPQPASINLHQLPQLNIHVTIHTPTRNRQRCDRLPVA